jgi:putative hemolysin
MPSLATQHCVNQGGKVEIRTEAAGEAGYCLFADGSECKEWAYYRGEAVTAGSPP